MAKALVCPSAGTVPIRLANPCKQSFTLNKHTIVATYEPLEAETAQYRLKYCLKGLLNPQQSINQSILKLRRPHID